MLRRILSGILCLVMVLTSLPLRAMAETMPEHEHDYLSVTTQEATCTQMEITTWLCDCGDSFTLDNPALGHSYEEGICALCGEAENSAVPEPQMVTVTLDGLEDVEIDADGMAEFVLEYTCIAAELLTFRWQRLDPLHFAEAYPEGTEEDRDAAWESIDTASNAVYTLTGITADNHEEYTRYLYRCVVSLDDRVWISEEAALLWNEPEATEPLETEPQETEHVRDASDEMETTVEDTPVTEFTYTIDSQGATITKYTGTAVDVRIPAVIEGVPVTKIASAAFSGKTTLQTVVIPESVTEIADGGQEFSGVFYNCTALKSVTLPEGLTYIGRYAFNKCSALSDITLPKSLSEIGTHAFRNCDSLCDLTLPEGLTGIGSYAFANCDKLSSVSIPASLISTGSYTFYGCTSLISITLAEGLSGIGDSSFRGCTALCSITLPESLTGIGNNAFYGCTKLTGISLSEKLTAIGSKAFYGCTSLNAIAFADGLTEIGSEAFYNCRALTEVEFPSTLEALGKGAFQNCNVLERVTLPGSLTDMGESVFQSCTALNDVTLSEGLTGISSRAFAYCSGLRNIILPKSLTGIGSAAFSNCTGLTGVTFPDDLTTLGNSAFSGCTCLTGVTLPGGLTDLETSVFEGCTGLTGVVFPAGLTSLGTSVFKNCTGLESVVFPASLTGLGASAFSGCTSLSSVTLHEGLTSIGNGVFSGCSGLRNIVFPASLTSIGSSAFSNTSLSSVVLPESIVTLGEGVFSGCALLTSVHLPDTMTILPARSFYGCIKLPQITLPAGLTAIEESAFYDCRTLESITLPDGLTGIGSSAFYGCTGLTGITLSESLISIEYGAFSNCTALTAIHLPEGLTSLGGSAFSGCEKLTEVCLPDQLTALSDNAFNGCYALVKVELPKNLTTIGEGTFYNCDSLASIMLPEGLISVEKNAFYSSGLTDVVLPNSVETIGAYAFRYCTGLERVTLSDRLTDIGAYAFSDCSSLGSVDFPEGLMRVDNYAFWRCTNLNKVKTNESLNFIGTNAFADCSNLTLYVWPGSCADEYAQNNSIEKIYYTDIGNNGTLEITLNSGLYRGMQLLLDFGDYTTSRTITEESVYFFSGLRTEGSCVIRILNPAGEIILQTEVSNITAQTYITLEDASSIGTLLLQILDEEENDKTHTADIRWYDDAGRLYATGAEIFGVPTGKVLTCRVQLSADAVCLYRFPEDIIHTVTPGENSLTVSLERISEVTLSGSVSDTKGAISGASVMISQKINGKYNHSVTAITDREGQFTAVVPAWTALLTVYASGYSAKTMELSDLKADTELEPLVLEAVRGPEITLDVRLSKRVRSGEKAETQVLTALDDLEISVRNVTQNRNVSDVLRSGMMVVLCDGAEIGDQIEVVVSGLNGSCAPASVMVTLDAQMKAAAQLELTEYGSVDASFENTGNEIVQMLVYRENGALAASAVQPAGEKMLASGILEDGNYTVVLMGHSDFLVSPTTLEGLTLAGFEKNRDYVIQTVEVCSGTVTPCAFKTVPTLKESRFYYTDAGKTVFTSSKTLISAGKFFTLRAKTEFAEAYRGKVTDIQWVFELPEGLEYYAGTLSVDKKEAGYEQTDNLLIVPVEDPSLDVRLCAVATESGEVTPAAYLQFVYDGRTIRQPIGAVTVQVDPFDFEVTEKTYSPSVSVYGSGTPCSDILVYDNGILVGQTRSNAAGRWMLTFDLYKPGSYSQHKIHAEIKMVTGARIRSNTHTVVYQYSPDPVFVKTVSMYQSGSSKPDVVFDFQNPQGGNLSYTVVGDTTFTFLAEFDCDDLSRLSDVKLEVSLDNGTTRVLDMIYNEPLQAFVTSSLFSINALPVNVAASYLCDQELVFSGEHMADLKADMETLTNLYEEMGEGSLFSFAEELTPMVLPEENPDVPYSEELLQAVEEYNQALENFRSTQKTMEETQKKLFRTVQNGDNFLSMSNDLFSAEVIQEDSSTFSILDMLEEGYSVYRVGTGNEDFVLTRLILNPETGAFEQTVIDATSDGSGLAAVAQSTGLMAASDEEYRINTFASQNPALPDGFYCPVQSYPKDIYECMLPLVTAPKVTTKVSLSEEANRNPEVLIDYFKMASDLNSSAAYVGNLWELTLLDDLSKDLESALLADLEVLIQIDDHREKLWKDIEADYQKYEDALKTDPDAAKKLETQLNKKLNNHDDWLKLIQDGYENNDKAWKCAKVLDVLEKAGAIFDAVNIGLDVQDITDLNKILEYNDDPEAERARARLIGRLILSGCGIAAFYTGCGALVGAILFGTNVGLFGDLDDDVKRIKAKYSGSEQAATPRRDPSGFVYEAVLSNRLQGVHVTCYERLTKYDIYEEPYNEILLWDASEYDQANPQITDELGQYAWDVPAGWWQVKAELEGYETAYSEWLPVPPPQLDVNLGMVSYDAPEITDVFAQPGSVDVTFSKYLRAETVTADAITVSVNEQPISGTIELLNPEESPANKDLILVSKLRFVPDNQLSDGEKVEVSVSSKVLSYADVAVKADEKQETTVLTIPENLFAPESVSLVYQGQGTIAIQAQPAEYAANETVQIQLVSDLFLKAQEQAVVLDDNGSTLIHIEGLLPGETEIQFTMSDGRLTAKTRVKILMPGDADTVGILNLSQSYLALKKGEEAQLTVEVSPRSLADRLIWTVEEGGEKVVSVDANGKITALNSGTGYLLVTAANGETTLTARCRVDVTEGVELEGVQLSTTKATTELYSTDYTNLEILLKLPQNYTMSVSQAEVQDNGIAIDSARFTDDAMAELFQISILDDRRIQIVPTEEAVERAQANAKSVAGKYTGTLTVTVHGEEYETDKLTLTVKQTKPKVKATVAAFNSFYTGQSQSIVITGGTPTAIYENDAKNTAKTTAIPTWLDLEGDILTLNETAPRKSVSDKAYLLIDTEEWRIPAAVTLSVKNSYKVPGVKLSASSVTVSNLQKAASVELKLLCTSKTDILKDLNITNITAPEGYTVENFNDETGAFTLRAENGFKSGKLTLKVTYGDITKSLTLTVKTQAVKLKLSASKVTLNKDLKDTATVAVSAATGGYGVTNPVLTFDDTKLDARYANGKLTVSLEDGAEYGKTYPVTVSAYEGAPVVKLSVAVPKQTAAVKSTIKASGTLDVIREGTAITIKPTYTNAAYVNVDKDAVLKIYSSADKYKTVFAEVKAENGIFVIDKSVISDQTLKYKAQLETDVYENEEPVKSAMISLSVKMGTAKLTVKTSGTTLFGKDRNDRALVWFETKDAALNAVSKVEIKDAKYQDKFEVIDYGNGQFVIGFKDGVDESLIGKTVTLNLNIFIEGNQTEKANTTAKVKLTIVK